jgi:hypothetical protein
MSRYFLAVLVLVTSTLLTSRVADAAGPFGLGQKPIPYRGLTLNSLDSIHTIALLEVPDPAYYYFGEGTGGATFMFGIIGSIGEKLATGQDSHEYGDFSFAKNIQDSLRRYLQANNFKVIEIAVNRGKKVALVKDYDSVKIKGVDAYLDVVPLKVGYKQSDLGGVNYEDIGPILSVVVRLVSARTKEVLYADTISYGWAKAATTRVVDIESPPDHQFTNKADLKENKERAIEQLIQGIQRVSLEIAGNFSTYDWYMEERDSLSDNDLPDLALVIDSEVLFLGQAAAEITSKTYDEGLWEKALNLAGGDEQKRDGIYIKLRSDQLALGKKKAQVDANQNGQSVSGYNSTYWGNFTHRYMEYTYMEPGTDINGTYRSEITRINGLKADNAKIVFRQRGIEIVGTNISKKDNDIIGTREGDTIKFKYQTQAQGRWQEYTGKWKISSDRTRLEGSLENFDGKKGKWKLTKIE